MLTHCWSLAGLRNIGLESTQPLNEPSVPILVTSAAESMPGCDGTQIAARRPWRSLREPGGVARRHIAG